MIYAVIDTNVLVSALLTSNPSSATKRVFDMLPDGKIIPLYNIEVLAEYNEVLKRSKFHFDTKKVDRIIKFIEEHGVDTERTSFNESMPDESDRVFYEITLSVDDSFLVTGNLKHYPKVPKVVTPAEFLEIIGSK